jgi:hypothetical protein
MGHGWPMAGRAIPDAEMPMPEGCPCPCPCPLLPLRPLPAPLCAAGVPVQLGRIWWPEAARLEDPLDSWTYPTALGHQNQVGNAMAYLIWCDSTSFVR